MKKASIVNIPKTGSKNRKISIGLPIKACSKVEEWFLDLE